MLVTQIDNRRLKKARRLMDLRILRVQSIQNQAPSGLADKYIRIEAYNALRSAQVHFTYLLDQQSARLARYLHRPSFAGVPAASPAQRRHSFMTKWGDLTDISKQELPYKERRDRYIEEIKSNLNSWKGLPPLPFPTGAPVPTSPPPPRPPTPLGDHTAWHQGEKGMSYRSPPPGYIDVGRSTIYGNPFRIGSTHCGVLLDSAGSTIPHFKEYAESRMKTDPEFRDAIHKLKGKKLWCPGCGTNSPTCHARVLEELALR